MESIIHHIEAALDRISQLVGEAGHAAHLLDRLDDRLLANAIRSNFVPQDPTDDLAEVED